MDQLLLQTATAFGLAASAGLNTTLPLLVVGLLARLGQLELASPYDALASTETLGALAAFAIFEFVADKVPGVDHALHAVQLPLAASAGAILFASQSSVVTSVSPTLAILVGLLTASTVHGARAVARPAVSLGTGGLGNPCVSAVEDGGACVLAASAILLPPVGLLATVVVLILAAFPLVWGIRRWRLRPWRPAGSNVARNPE